MSFQTPITIKETLYKVNHYEYILPAIQRSFVWGPDQICRLFDSLMRGYPIGTFLFWNLQESDLTKYTFYDFVQDYHQLRDSGSEIVEPHKLPAATTITAILDGQQRLTSLNIGLYGSYANKLPRKHWKSPDAYPTRRLYLNLLAPANPDNDDGLAYDLRFLTDEHAACTGVDEHWFRVGDVLKFDGLGGITTHLAERGLLGVEGAKHAVDALSRLYEVVNLDKCISYYAVKESDLDKVLDIFIRVNSGGTVLSYSDLLLSIATAQWDKIDAREAINNLVSELNETGLGFWFNKDFVLKAGLVLIGSSDIRFRVSNFDVRNMDTFEQQWPGIERALRLAVRLVSSFGLFDRTLTSSYAVVPIAYYLFHRGLTEKYLSAKEHVDDRALIRSWLLRSLLKPGTWSTRGDALLARTRAAIQEEGAKGFPLARIEAEMANLRKSLAFGPDEVEEVLQLRYGMPRTFAALALLYPNINFQTEVHVDHIFPRSLFDDESLGDGAVPVETWGDFRWRSNELPNLQLLPFVENVQKLDTLPRDWIAQYLPGEDENATNARTAFMAAHDMHALPNSLIEFPAFFDDRKERMRARLTTLLSVGMVDGLLDE